MVAGSTGFAQALSGIAAFRVAAVSLGLVSLTLSARAARWAYSDANPSLTQRSATSAPLNQPCAASWSTTSGSAQ